MFRTALVVAALIVPALCQSGERISGENSYVLNEERFHFDTGTYWRQDNDGSFSVTEGPIDPGYVRCLGAGFGGASESTGGGLCIFGEGKDTFTWRWEVHFGAPNTWTVVGATGKYLGMQGQGIAKSQIGSEFFAMAHRITEWEGEITLPKQP